MNARPLIYFYQRHFLSLFELLSGVKWCNINIFWSTLKHYEYMTLNDYPNRMPQISSSPCPNILDWSEAEVKQAERKLKNKKVKLVMRPGPAGIRMEGLVILMCWEWLIQSRGRRKRPNINPAEEVLTYIFIFCAPNPQIFVRNTPWSSGDCSRSQAPY